MTIQIYHLDDDVQILERMERILSKNMMGHPIKTHGFESLTEFEKSLSGKPHVDIFILDAHLGDSPLKSDPLIADGPRIAATCRERYPESLIFICSSATDIKTIRASLQMGANDFIAKESKPDEILSRIESALRERSQNGRPLADDHREHVGSTLAAISLRAPNLINSAVNCIYIEGESGTGKEVAAATFERALPAGTPFVKVNCGAIAASLIASELFGYAKGAFTGATTDKAGLIEASDKGWIFLDEIATLPSEAQVSLLRAIDNQAVRRVGSTVERQVSFRVISATNESLEELVEQGKFRKDLWQRLRETQINLPPLRERRHEIPELIDFFCKTMRGGPYQLAPNVLDILSQYDWREGNIRELRNCLRAMTEKSVNRVLTPRTIPERIWSVVENNSSQHAAGSQNVITLSWSGSRPTFDDLCHYLLLEIIRAEFKIQDRMSVRGLAKATGIAKSSMPTRIKNLLDSKIISPAELGQMCT